LSVFGNLNPPTGRSPPQLPNSEPKTPPARSSITTRRRDGRLVRARLCPPSTPTVRPHPPGSRAIDQLNPAWVDLWSMPCGPGCAQPGILPPGTTLLSLKNPPWPCQWDAKSVRAKPGRCTHRAVWNHIPAHSNHPAIPASAAGTRHPGQSQCTRATPTSRPLQAHLPLSSHYSLLTLPFFLC